MKITKLLISAVASFAMLYGASALAAFSGGATVLVNGSATVTGEYNTGVNFDESSYPLVTPLPGATGPLASVGGGTVDFGFSNPFADVDFAPLVSNPLSNALDGTVLMSVTDFFGSTVQITFDELLAIVPTSGQLNGSVDFAGLGIMTLNGAEATEVFWSYNISGGSAWVNIDTAGAASSLNAFSSNPVPLPAALWLFASALVGVAGAKRVRR
ncbi:MAG: hypothetical protein HKO71_01135 [Pseudomonadales bacterium]|nr:hypothetical protein [Pseudomonadales bacterium]